MVTRDVLIPRPETEFLVDAVLELLEPDVPGGNPGDSARVVVR